MNKYEDDAIASCRRGSLYNVARIWINNDTVNGDGLNSGYYSPRVTVSTYDNIVTAYLRGSSISCTSKAPAGHIYANSVAPRDNITTVSSTSFYRGYTNGVPGNFTTRGGDLSVQLDISSVPTDGASHTLVAAVYRCFSQRLDAGGTSAGGCGPEYIDVIVTRPSPKCAWTSVPGSVVSGQSFNVTARVSSLRPGFTYALGSGDAIKYGESGGSSNPDDARKGNNGVWGAGRSQLFNSNDQDVTFTVRAPSVSSTRNVDLVFSVLTDSGGFWTTATCDRPVTVTATPTLTCTITQQPITVFEDESFSVRIKVINNGSGNTISGDQPNNININNQYDRLTLNGNDDPNIKWDSVVQSENNHNIRVAWSVGQYLGRAIIPNNLGQGQSFETTINFKAKKISSEDMSIVQPMSWGLVRDYTAYPAWYGGASCGQSITVKKKQNKPYLRAMTNDVMAGAQFNSNATSCTVMADKLGVRTSSFWGGRGYRGGSGSEYATYSSGFIEQDNFDNNMVGYAGANGVRQDFTTYGGGSFRGWNLLFGNASWNGKSGNSGNSGSDWTDGRYGAFYGGFGIPDPKTPNADKIPVAVQCVRDYYSELENTAKTLTGNNTATSDDGIFKSIFSHAPNESFPPLGVGSLTNGNNTVMLIDGDVLINQNISSPSVEENVFKKPTSFTLIVKGRVSIASDVTQIDANIIAQPDGDSGGIIETCSSYSFSLSQKTVSGHCAGQLKINGVTAARIVKPLRTFGTVGTTYSVNSSTPDQSTLEYAPYTIGDWNSNGANSQVLVDKLNSKAAEIFTFDPTSYFATGKSSDSGAAQSFRELPPVY